MALRTCAAATDGTGCNGFRAGAITMGVYVRVCVRLCVKSIRHEEPPGSV